MEKEQILTMAFELGAAIAQSQQMDILRNMQDRVSSDKGASDLIMNYQDTMQQMDNKRRDGLDILPAEISHLETLQNELTDNPLVSELIQVQQEFNNLMEGVYFAINQAINGASCSSDCTSCQGGCSM